RGQGKKSPNAAYESWIEKYEPGPAELAKQRARRFAWTPRISILVSVHGLQPPLLGAMVQSVIDQTYVHWELCLATHAAHSAAVQGLLKRFEIRDCIRMVSLPDAWDAAEDYNSALGAATGTHIALLHPNDALAPFALFEVVRALNDDPDTDFLYSDEDCLD